MLERLSDKFADFCGSFNDWRTGFTGKLAGYFQLARLSSWSMRRLQKPAGLVGIEAFVAVSLVVYFFFLLLPQAEAPRAYDGNEMNIYLFTYVSDHPYTHRDLIADFENWRARLAGPMIAGWMYDLSYRTFSKLVELNLLDTDKFAFGGYFARIPVIVFGLYHALWLLLLYLILILYRRDALLIMLGVFGGLMYNFTIPAGRWFYPWDMPTMFFFTWACLLYDQRRLLPLMVVVWLGSLFKETTLCCALLVLLGQHWPWKRRLAAFVALAGACFLTRKLLMAIYDVKTMFFALNNSNNIHELAHKTWSLLVANIHLLFSPGLNHVLFTNAGALFIMMLIPWHTRRDVVFKILAVAFILGQFLCGIIIEFRIWYEILPLGWMVISETISNRYRTVWDSHVAPDALPPGPVTNQRTAGLLKGSYWLMMSVGLALALALFFLTR
jgi:hypothetical protein